MPQITIKNVCNDDPVKEFLKSESQYNKKNLNCVVFHLETKLMSNFLRWNSHGTSGVTINIIQWKLLIILSFNLVKLFFTVQHSIKNFITPIYNRCIEFRTTPYTISKFDSVNSGDTTFSLWCYNTTIVDSDHRMVLLYLTLGTICFWVYFSLFFLQHWLLWRNIVYRRRTHCEAWYIL